MESDKEHGALDEKETGRIEAFSDGVFAIAITLLVLNIKVPYQVNLYTSQRLAEALWQQWSAFLAYGISFITILIIWVSHHRLFNYIKRSTDTFLFLNGLLLFFITFVPFPTALIAKYIQTRDAPLAMAIYSGTYLAVAIVFNIVWSYASRDNRLLDKRADPCLVRNITKQYMFGPPLYFIAFLFSFISVPIAITMCFVLAIFFAFTGVISRNLPCHLVHKA